MSLQDRLQKYMTELDREVPIPAALVITHDAFDSEGELEADHVLVVIKVSLYR